MREWKPWADGRATRLTATKVVGTFPLCAEYAREGWKVTAIEVDDEGVFVTATFEIGEN